MRVGRGFYLVTRAGTQPHNKLCCHFLILPVLSTPLKTQGGYSERWQRIFKEFRKEKKIRELNHEFKNGQKRPYQNQRPPRE